MLTQYNTMMEATKSAVDAADAIKSGADKVLEMLKSHHARLQVERESFAASSKAVIDHITNDRQAFVGEIEGLQKELDVMIETIVGSMETTASALNTSPPEASSANG